MSSIARVVWMVAAVGCHSSGGLATAGDSGTIDSAPVDAMVDSPADAAPDLTACTNPTYERCDATMTTCLVSPLPELSVHGEVATIAQLYAVKNADEAWGWGSFGIAHYTASCGWQVLDTSTAPGPGAFPVSETGPSNVWFSGGGRWTGTSFIGFSFPPSQPVWTLGPDTGWYGCNRWDGTSWTSNTCTPTAISGSSASDVWLGGALGALWHWDGTTFIGPIDSPLSNASPTPPAVDAILSFATDDAYFRTALSWYHRDGSTFTQLTSPPTFPATPFWFEEQYWNGTEFLFPSPPPQGAPLHTTFNSLTSGWSLLENHTDPNSLFHDSPGWKPYFSALPTVYAFDKTHMFARRLNLTGEDDIPIAYLDPTGWHDGALVFPHMARSEEVSELEILTLYPTGPDELWGIAYQSVAGVFVQGYLIHYKAGTTTVLQQAENIDTKLWDFQSSGPDDVWIALDTKLWHWNGTTLDDALDAEVHHLWIPSPGTVWALDFTTVHMFDGTTWTTMPGPPNGNSGTTWGSSFSDVWSGVAHWDGSQWKFPTNPGIDTSVTRVVATGPHDAFFIGGGITHYDGSVFTPITGGGGTLTGFDPVSRDLWFGFGNETVRFHPPM